MSASEEPAHPAPACSDVHHLKMRPHQAPFSHTALKDSNYSQVLFLWLYVTQARQVTCRCCNHCTCASCWGSIMQASPKQGWAAGETDGMRVRLPLLMLTQPGQGQEAHGNSTIKSVWTRRENLHPPLHKIRGYTIHPCSWRKGKKTTIQRISNWFNEMFQFSHF